MSHFSAVRSPLYAALLVAIGAAALAQQPDLGVRAVTVADTPYTFDTAEQHGIRVSVVVRGLPHPYSLAFLPNGDALVAERSGGLRLVRNAASGKGGAATLVPQAIGGTPESVAEAAYQGKTLVSSLKTILGIPFMRRQE